MRTTEVLGKRNRVQRQKEQHIKTISLEEHYFCVLQGLQRREEHTYSPLSSPSKPVDHQGCLEAEDNQGVPERELADTGS